MSKRMLYLLAGVVMTSLATGCCCMNKCNPCGGYGAMYGATAAPCSPCGPGGCAPTYGPSGFNSSAYDAAFAPATTTISSVPIYTSTVLAPSLPAY